MNRLKAKTRMIRVLAKNAICATGLPLNLCRKFTNNFRNCAVVCEITNYLDQAFSSDRLDAPPTLDPQAPRADRVSLQIDLPNAAQTQVHRAGCAREPPAPPLEASKLRQMPF